MSTLTHMDSGILWLERLSSWMEIKGDSDPVDPSIAKLSEEWRVASLESDSLIKASNVLQRAFSQVVGPPPNK